jgi:hypothetical protein
MRRFAPEESTPSPGPAGPPSPAKRGRGRQVPVQRKSLVSWKESGKPGIAVRRTYFAAQMVPLGLSMGTPTLLPYSVQEPS